MNSNPKISVIIPLYNLSQYVEQFVNSLKEQSYTNFEAIIVNDGSTDDSLERATQLTADDQRFKVINQKNGGAMLARNSGIEKSCGEYITFLDADDMLYPKALEAMAELASESSADIITTRVMRVCPKYSTPLDDQSPERMCGVEFLELLLMHRIWGFNCSKLYRRELFEGIKFHPLSLSEDMMINIQIALKQPTVIASKMISYAYIQHQSSMSHAAFTLEYMERYSQIVESELMAVDKELGGRAELLALLNKIRWFMVYTSKSRNKWIGDSEFAQKLYPLITKYRDELKTYNLGGEIRSIALYRHRSLLPLLKIISTIKRVLNSLNRRLNRVKK